MGSYDRLGRNLGRKIQVESLRGINPATVSELAALIGFRISIRHKGGTVSTMQMDYPPFDPIDKIAELTLSLTYGDMTDLAAELWKAAGDKEISAKTLPAILHRWASETRHQHTGTALLRLDETELYELK
jgi:hypothetical protein